MPAIVIADDLKDVKVESNAWKEPATQAEIKLVSETNKLLTTAHTRFFPSNKRKGPPARQPVAASPPTKKKKAKSPVIEILSSDDEDEPDNRQRTTTTKTDTTKGLTEQQLRSKFEHLKENETGFKNGLFNSLRWIGHAFDENGGDCMSL